MKYFLFIFALTASSAFAGTEIFKMYLEPNHKVTACDLYDELELSVDGYEGTATFEQKLNGSCRIGVSPGQHMFALELDHVDGCGATLYKQATGSAREITVIDNRTNICENVLPGRIVVVLPNSGPSGQEVRLYSLDR